MPRYLAIVLLLGAAALPATAQEEGDEAAARYEKLQEDFRQDVEKARAEQRRQAEEDRKAMEKAQREGKPLPRMSAMRMGPPVEVLLRHLPRFEAAARDHAGRDEALPFLAWVLANGVSAGRVEAAQAALGTIAEHHLKSAQIEPHLATIARQGTALGKEKVDALLRRIERENPRPPIQARAILERVRAPLTRAPIATPPYRYAREEALRAAKLGGDETLARQIQSLIDGREKLIPGKVAPDISGVDLDGVAFKLSDYRGKIILLDFWGDW